jgi:probable O-glycosylation ligase (exosortase A-associated)
MLRTPIAGLLAWIWVTLMNPQREVWGILAGFNLNEFVAALTLLTWVVSRERKVVPVDLFTGALLAFAAWTTVTTLTAFDRQFSSVLWDRTMKTILLVLAVATLANTRARIQAVTWMVVVSLGYYAVKGGGFALLTGGHERVYGPRASMIEDNNALGLALIVLLPLINYVRETSQLLATRLVLLGTIAFTVVAVIGTYSRGALVTLAAAGATYAMKSRSGLLLLLAAGALALAAPSVMPAGWVQRMSTLQAYKKDESFNGRVEAWKASIAIAETRATGGGFSATNIDWVARQYSEGRLGAGKAAHSIYFEVLGDHGFIGLALYLLVLLGAAVNTAMVLYAARGRPDLAWAARLARMLQVSLVAFLVGGSALSMAYYDGVLVVLALTSALLQVVRQPATDAVRQTSPPKWKVIGEPSPERLGAGSKKTKSPIAI